MGGVGCPPVFCCLVTTEKGGGGKMAGVDSPPTCACRWPDSKPASIPAAKSADRSGRGNGGGKGWKDHASPPFPSLYLLVARYQTTARQASFIFDFKFYGNLRWEREELELTWTRLLLEEPRRRAKRTTP